MQEDHQDHALSQPELFEAEDFWTTKKRRKPYQKRDFGQSHMLTRSKALPPPVSND